MSCQCRLSFLQFWDLLWGSALSISFGGLTCLLHDIYLYPCVCGRRSPWPSRCGRRRWPTLAPWAGVATRGASQKKLASLLIIEYCKWDDFQLFKSLCAFFLLLIYVMQSFYVKTTNRANEQLLCTYHTKVDKRHCKILFKTKIYFNFVSHFCFNPFELHL